MSVKKQGILRLVRIGLAAFFFIGINLLLLDYSGLLARYLGWMAKIQFLPAVLALNFGVFITIFILTLVFGRFYCSTICPLGVWQDIVSHLAARRKPQRFSYMHRRRILRILFVGVTIAGVFTTMNLLVALLAPFGTWSRIVVNLVQPLWGFVLNGISALENHLGIYHTFPVEVWLKSFAGLGLAVFSLLLVSIIAWFKGRLWCNTVCPVGTILGFAAKRAVFRPTIDFDKCIRCKKCERICKSSCINIRHHRLDGGRCVDCFDCIAECPVNAIYFFPPTEKPDNNTEEKTRHHHHHHHHHGENCASTSDSPKHYQTVAEQLAAQNPSTESRPDKPAEPAESTKESVDTTRRMMIGALALALPMEALAQKAEGGLAPIHIREQTRRNLPLVPAGSLSVDNFTTRCTACGLCISKCPENVLRPSTSLVSLLQPTMSFERGWCRPECTLCSEVCPTGAITRVTPEQKTAIRIGHAVWMKDFCLPYSEGTDCGNCARHCPGAAIKMVRAGDLEFTGKGPADPMIRVPLIDENRCIGCGACEHYCPSEPMAAIYIEGHPRQNEH